MYVPELGKKISSLLQRDTNITTRAKLASELGVSQSNISIWVSGTGARAPDIVPDRHIAKLSALFNIPVNWLECKSSEEFTALLDSRDPFNKS